MTAHNTISAFSSTKWILSTRSFLKMNILNTAKTVRHSNPRGDEKNPNQKLTAKYWGPSVLRPARFPHIEAALICCICCWSCWAIRFCSLSFCVSANFTTMGEEQPCKQQFKQLHTCYPQQSQKYWFKTHWNHSPPPLCIHIDIHIYIETEHFIKGSKSCLLLILFCILVFSLQMKFLSPTLKLEQNKHKGPGAVFVKKHTTALVLSAP